MQPQEPGFDWWNAASGAGGAILGAASTLLTWIISAARMEPRLQNEIKEAVAVAKQHLEERIDHSERRAMARIDEELLNWRDTLLAMRQKIDDVEKASVRKDDFNDFRREHRDDFQQLRKESREDFAALQRNIAEMLKASPHGK